MDLLIDSPIDLSLDLQPDWPPDLYIDLSPIDLLRYPVGHRFPFMSQAVTLLLFRFSSNNATAN